MFEILCKNRAAEAGEAELDLSVAAVTKVFTAAKKDGNKKAKRAAWQARARRHPAAARSAPSPSAPSSAPSPSPLLTPPLVARATLDSRRASRS